MAAAAAAPSAGVARPAGSDRELVRRAQGGEEAAYEALVKLNQARVFAIVGSILRQREDIEDVAQQVFIKAYLALQRFDGRSAFSTWLYKIAVNECRDYLRKKRVRRLVYEADLSEDQVQMLEQAEPGRVGVGRVAPSEMNAGRRVELRQAVDWLLARLSDEERVMMVLKEVEGYSVEEIAEVLEMNVNTVKVRMFRARGRLTAAYRRQAARGRAG